MEKNKSEYFKSVTLPFRLDGEAIDRKYATAFHIAIMKEPRMFENIIKMFETEMPIIRMMPELLCHMLSLPYQNFNFDEIRKKQIIPLPDEDFIEQLNNSLTQSQNIINNEKNQKIQNDQNKQKAHN